MIYTFYSYKGGVGRSMALANVAAYLAKLGSKVLILDWDLEAPGVERYFENWPSKLLASRKDKPGIVDLITGVAVGQPVSWRDCLLTAKLSDTVLVDIISAGRKVDDYTSRVQNLHWDTLFSEHALGNYLEDLRNEWASVYDFILVDSRTGISDIGGVCTILLPNVLVVVLIPNAQSIEGTVDVIKSVREKQMTLPVERMRLFTIPILGRDERNSEKELSAKWRGEVESALGPYCSDWLRSNVRIKDVLDKLYIPAKPYSELRGASTCCRGRGYDRRSW